MGLIRGFGLGVIRGLVVSVRTPTLFRGSAVLPVAINVASLSIITTSEESVNSNGHIIIIVV